MEKDELRKAVNHAARKADERKVLSCRTALKLAEKHGVRPIEIGRICNELKIKITACQLGCFQ